MNEPLPAWSEPFIGDAVARLRREARLDRIDRDGMLTLLDHYAAHPPKGEIVLLVGPPVEPPSAADPDALLRAALAEMSVSKAAGQVAKATGLDRQTLYARAVELKSE